MQHRKPIDRVLQLLQSGLAKDQSKLAYYMAVLHDPNLGFSNAIYRIYAVELFNTVYNYVLNDPILYNRFRQELLRDNPRLHYEQNEIKPNTVKVLKELAHG